MCDVAAVSGASDDKCPQDKHYLIENDFCSTFWTKPCVVSLKGEKLHYFQIYIRLRKVFGVYLFCFFKFFIASELLF